MGFSYKRIHMIENDKCTELISKMNSIGFEIDSSMSFPENIIFSLKNHDNYLHYVEDRYDKLINYRASIVRAGGFCNRTTLTVVNLPFCTTIGSSAFQSCPNLTTVSFPACTMIYDYVFSDCTSLTSVYLLGSSYCSLQGHLAFYNTPIFNSSYTGSYGSIYVPASMIDTYKAASPWDVYASQFVAIT